MSRQTHVKPEMAPALAVRIAAEDRRRLEEIAQRENRTLSGEVRHIIARRIAEYEQEVAV
jgi:predicted DNA-binding protein